MNKLQRLKDADIFHLSSSHNEGKCQQLSFLLWNLSLQVMFVTHILYLHIVCSSNGDGDGGGPLAPGWIQQVHLLSGTQDDGGQLRQSQLRRHPQASDRR